MVNINILKDVLQAAMSTGGDFAEIYGEDGISNSINLVDGRIDKMNSGRSYGIGIRIYKGFNSVYVYTNDSSRDSLIEMAKRAAIAINNVPDQKSIDIHLNERIHTNIHPVILVPKYASDAKKVKILKDMYRIAKDYSSDITQVVTSISDIDKNIMIANSDGLLTYDRRIRTRVIANSIAGNDSEKQTGFENIGKSCGFELFNQVADYERLAYEASKTAVTMLHADYCKSGQMPVAIDSGFGGVIFHEACGHALEATSVSKRTSVFCGKLNQKIANECVSAYDDATIPGEWGSFNCDDEGTASEKNTLIENGVLKSFLVDRLNSRRMTKDVVGDSLSTETHHLTGSARRGSYKYAPTSRMSNTYIGEGKSTNEEIIASIDNGLYAKKMGGGSVNPTTGEFNFSVSEAYLIVNGKIDKPLRGVSLVGKGHEVLERIVMVGNKRVQSAGMCGSSSGGVPVTVGQPMIKVSHLTVGGK